MPSKVNPNDWDTFFSSTGPRRSGPVGIFLRTVLLLGVVGGLGYGLLKFNQQLQSKNAQNQQTAQALAPTRTAQALANASQRTAEALPSPTPDLPTGRSLAQTPLRFEPNDRAQSKGNLNPNDRVQFIQSQDSEGQLWWEVRLIERANPNAEGSAPDGTIGWTPASTLTEPPALPPTQPPADQPTQPPAGLPPVTIDGNALNLYRDQQTNISIRRDNRWNPQGAPLDLSVLLAQTPDGGDGVLAAKVVGVAQDAGGYQAAIGQVAAALAKPGAAPEVTYTAQSADNLDATIKLIRVVGGRDFTIIGRVRAQRAPGNSVGVTLAFVPDNSFGPNEAVLNQIIQGTIFQ